MNANEPRPRGPEATDLIPRPAEPISTLEDPRVVEALEEYQAAIEAGEKPSRQAFLERYPEIEAALAECLEGIEALHASFASHGPTTVTAADAFGGLTPKTPLGDFQIVREIGRGGMGIVYEAVQLSLGRRVALKVLPFAAALDGRQLQRFKNEAQAAAHLHHTNIVPVYAIGAERGVHFYAMQLIDGQNLSAVVDNLRKGENRGSPESGWVNLAPDEVVSLPKGPASDTGKTLQAQLSTQRSQRSTDFFRTVTRLVIQAAQGLEYAHGMGIIHRDIKPANLLVDNSGTVWITDFGLAQFHTDLGLTQSGDLLGTLRYMSPEQSGGPRGLVDHRTDVYSLGATLYELLTLRPIFDGSDRQTLLRQITDEEPKAPRSIDPSIPPELETIVLKAVAKTPVDRYATAGAFAEDLERFLRHEPILARRATTIQRARKWLRRHPSVVVSGVLLLMLVAAGSLLSAVLVRGAYDRERQRAEEAEQRFKLALRSVEDILTMANRDLADNPQMAGLRRQLLEFAVSYYQELIEQRREDPQNRSDLEKDRNKVKDLLNDLAVMQGAGQLFLLKHQGVLDDLRLAPDQDSRLKEFFRLAENLRFQNFHEFHRLDRQERQDLFLRMAKASEAAVEGILSPQQLRRLRQIALQLKGLSGFRESDVASALKLTPEQADRIRRIEADLFFDRPDCHSGRSPEASKAPGQWYQSGIDKVRDVLTPEQWTRWQEMAGEPYTGPVPDFHHYCPPGSFKVLKIERPVMAAPLLPG